MATRATTVGAVALDMSINTSGLTQAINDIARSAGNQLTSAFQNAASGCQTSINGLSQSISQMTSGIQSSMNQMSQNMTAVLQNSASQISANMQNQMSQMTQGVSSAVQSSASQTAQGMNQSTQSLSQHFGNAIQGANELRENVNDTAKSLGSTLWSAVKKVGAAIIGAFAIKQVVSFTKSCVEAAAQVKALNAQLEQTFNTLQTDAMNAISKVANESGILETRLQGVGTQIYAFAKASGMDSVSALNMMQEALQVTADSAAYYDRSIEDTAESLKSFLKGNFANDAALGISCTETTRNIAANKLYGKSYRELSEAQKQLTLLQMVKDANKLSGAMGQAAREADGWENVTGNLKEAWKQFKAAIGQPVLQALIPIIKNITSAIQSLTQTAQQAAKSLSELFGWDLSSAENTGNTITGIADSISDAEDEAQEEIEDTAKEQKNAQKSLAGFDNLNVLSLDKSDNSEEEEKNDQIAQTADLAKSSVDDLNNAVNSINLDGIKNKFRDVISTFEPLASAVKKNIQSTVDTAQKSVEKYFEKYGDKISVYSNRIKTNLKNTATQTANGITNILNEATASQERCGEELSTGYADLMGGASIFTLSFADVFTDGLDIVSENFEDWTVENSDTIGEFFDGINGNAANAMSTFGGILEDVGNTLTDWWDNTGSEAFDRLTEAFFDVQNVLLDFWNSYITPFIDYIIDSVGELWDKHLSKLWSGILEFISSLMDTVSALWNGLLRPLYDTFIKRIMVGIMGALKSVWDVISDVVGMIIDVIRGVIRSLQGVLDFITGIFTGDMEKAVKGFAEFVHGICIMIWGIIKGALNLIIDALNTVWSALYGVLKSIVDGVGDFVGAIGDLFGQNWGFSMPDEVPRIPRLAQGGLVRAPTIAMVGDNKNAYNDPEVISPLSKLQGMLDESSPDTEVLQQILMYLKMVYDECKNMGEINLTEEIDGDVFFKAMISRNNKYKNRHGGKGAFA